MFEFDFVWAFALLPAPLIVWWLLPPYRERLQSVRLPGFERVVAATGREPTRGGVLLRRNWAQWILAPMMWLALVTALAAPQFVEPPIEKVESARDLMLAIDLSGSMETPDMFDEAGNRITRLDAVKQVVGEFIDRREGDRLGIIVFGAQAFVQTPFTQDHDLVHTLLDQTRPRLAGPQTMIGDAIGLAIKTFENSEARDRVMILLTDGNDTGSKVPPKKAADIAAQAGVTIHTVAIGDPTAVGEAEMDLETLEQIAATTEGSAFRADDREQLEDIYLQIDALTPEEIETVSYRPTRPLFHWPLAAALLMVLGYHLLLTVALGLGRIRAHA
jgi:Ca-activated chloride channel family protein